MDVRPVTLEGRDVRLVPLTPDHCAGLAEVLDATLLQWFPQPVTGAEDLRSAIAAALAEQERGATLPFATIERAGGRPIGSTRFLNIDRTHQRAEIGWTWIGRAWQRTRINTEAKLLMLTHAFEAWGTIRVEFKTDSLNLQSREALRRLGAVEEGCFRNHMITASGRIRHSVWFSMTNAEWPAIKAKLEARLAQGEP